MISLSYWKINAMSEIKILDCTLRDGGYINNWKFGIENIKSIINNLVLSGCDYIECGIFKDCHYDSNRTLFSNYNQLKKIIPINSKAQFVILINYGDVSIDKINFENKDIIIKLTFKKFQVKEALEYSEKLVKKGYKLFINPMDTISYTEIELLNLIKKVNKINPIGFSIVDTTGTMSRKDTLSLYNLIENNLNNNIALCFHSHNNLQLSFSNAQVLMEENTTRTIIIDSSVFGMGRGAGNLCTELLVKYINDNHNGNYELLPILKIIDEQIAKIFAESPWGYSVPYYIAASLHCHPNYAKYLIDKQTLSVELITQILTKIPNDKRRNYDVNIIEDLYNTILNCMVDDTESMVKLTKLLKDKKILVLASGKSIVDEEEKVHNFIKKENPFIFSLNYIPQSYHPNVVLITNQKKYNSIGSINIPCITTSNIKQDSDYKLNYLSYIYENNIGENAALILFRILIKIGIESIFIAGLDGLSENSQEQYEDSDLINFESTIDFYTKNKKIKDYLNGIEDKLNINFITKSTYIN